MNELTEGVHYYINEDGFVVLTALFEPKGSSTLMNLVASSPALG